jgi:hypothetical protein
MYNLYIGDKDEHEILAWLCEAISPISHTKKEEFQYFSIYHGKDDAWVMNTSDVSDVSLQYDTITLVSFKNQSDAMIARLRWGGSIS